MKRMKQSKDPFEAAFEESPPESPGEAEIETETQNPSSVAAVPQASQSQEEDEGNARKVKNKEKEKEKEKDKEKDKEEDEEEEEDNMDVELSKFSAATDPNKMAAILSQLTEQQMSRYESFRRAGFQKANMKRLLASITGTQKISVPISIVVSGIAKLFVGEVVETARIVMKERKESGPIRPCHLREAYRRLKVEGKVFKRTVSRLFR